MSRVLTGKWRWNDVIETWDNMNVSVFFQGGSVATSNGEKIISIKFYFDGEQWLLEYDTGTKIITAGAGYHEANYAMPLEQYRVIDFGDGCEVDDDADGAIVRDWFLPNITRYGTIAEKMEQIAENEQKVYQSGYDKALEKGGYNEGYEDGKQAEYDAFWDAYLPQQHNWQYVFYSDRWSDSNFYPNKDLIPTGNLTFGFSSNRITDLKQRLIDCNVKLDTSKVSGGNYMFCYCSPLTRLPSISLVGLTSQITNTFENDTKLVEIEKIILKDDGSTTFKRWFDGCSSLTTVAFEGVIGNDIDFHWSTKLSWKSIESIVNHLYDAASGKTLTLSKAAVDEAFVFCWEDNDGNSHWVPGSDESNPYFPVLRDSKPNWQITLV